MTDVSGLFTRFFKWIQLRRELKFDMALSVLDKTKLDYNSTVALLTDKYDERTSKMGQFGSILTLVFTAISLVSAILTLYGFLPN